MRVAAKYVAASPECSNGAGHGGGSAGARVHDLLTSMSGIFDCPPQPVAEGLDTEARAAERHRIRGVVACEANRSRAVVVTVDLDPDPAGGTTVQLRAVAKELIVDQRTAEKAAQAVADLLTEPVAEDQAPTTWYEGQ